MTKKRTAHKKTGLIFYLSLVIFVVLVLIIFVVAKTLITHNINVDTSTKWNYDINKLQETKMNVVIDSISELPGVRPDLKLTEERDFDIYLERPTLGPLGLKEKDFHGYTSDLPTAIRPKIIYLSDIDDLKRDGGNTCAVASFPHRCFINMTLTKGPVSQLVKVVFSDNSFAQTKITIPYPGHMDDPVLLTPQTEPKTSDSFQMKFKDVGADSYKVSVSICHPYGNNGINPCLKQQTYNLIRRGRLLVIDSNQGSFTKALVVNIENKNGVVELNSKSPLSIGPEDTNVTYNVVAHKAGFADGIKTSIESRSGKNFKIKK